MTAPSTSDMAKIQKGDTVLFDVPTPQNGQPKDNRTGTVTAVHGQTVVIKEKGTFVRHREKVTLIPNDEQRTTYQERSVGTDGRVQAVSSAQTGPDIHTYFRQPIST